MDDYNIRTDTAFAIHPDEATEKLKGTLLKDIQRSCYVYRVDCGGCNGCGIEIFAAITPIFDAERFGIKVVSSGGLGMLAAILEKKIGLGLAEQDIYLNLAGGIRVVEPAADLAVALAVCSSLRNAAVDSGAVVFGEVGLTGRCAACPTPRRGSGRPRSSVSAAACCRDRTCLGPA